MKIMPHQMPVAPARSLVAPAVSQPFAAYLAGDAVDVGQLDQTRALGFEELGVFGLGREAPYQAQASLQPGQCLPHPRHARSGDVEGGVEALLAPRQAASDPAITSGGIAGSPSADRAGSVLERQPQGTGLVNEPGADWATHEAALGRRGPSLPRLDVQSRGGPNAAALRAFQERYRAAVNQQPGSVIVTSNLDGSVSVIAAAPNLSPEQSRALRRLATRMSAEHGLTLSGFSLNGADIPSNRRPTDRSS